MMAAFAKANGVDFASRGNDALRRVAERTVQGADNPQIFQAQTGSQQVLKDFDGDGQRSKLAWLEPYCWTVGCDGAMARKLSSLRPMRSEEHTSELQSLMRISYAVLCLKKKIKT